MSWLVDWVGLDWVALVAFGRVDGLDWLVYWFGWIGLGCLVVWLFGWLVGWFVVLDWVRGCLVGWLVGRSVGQLGRLLCLLGWSF